MRDPYRHELETAIEAWRAAEAAGQDGERLSEATRARILATVRQRRAAALPAQASLFLPLRRLMTAGVLPAAALTALLAAVALPGLWNEAPVVPGAGDEPVGLHLSKRGGEVVIHIANGGGPHRVHRSTDPRGLSGEVFRAEGSFRDRLEGGSELVFYRVD